MVYTRHTAPSIFFCMLFFFFQAEDGIRDYKVTGVQTCALPILLIVVVGREIAEFRRGNGCRIGLRTEGLWVGGEEALLGIEAVLAVGRFTAADLVMPVPAGGEVPVGIGVENMECVALVTAWRREYRLARKFRFACVVSQREAKRGWIAESK